MSTVQGQNIHSISQQLCTFFVYSATEEWSYFSGDYRYFEKTDDSYYIDLATGYLQADFEITTPDSYLVRAIVRMDVRGLSREHVYLQLETIFLKQLLKQQQEQQIATLELMGALNSSLKIKPLLQAIMDYALTALPVIDRGFLMLYDEALGRLCTVASRGVTDDIFDYEPGIGEGMAGYTFQTGESRIYPYKETLKIMWNVVPKNMEALLKATHLGRIEHNISMAVPISYEGRKFGVMIVHQYTNKRRFQENDLKLLNSFAAQAAVALRNAEAYEQIERLNKDYQKQHEIYSIFLNLSLQNDSEQKIIEKTKELIQEDVTYINLMDRKTFISEEKMKVLIEVKEPQRIQWQQQTFVFPVRNEQEIFGYILVEIDEPSKQLQMIVGNASISLSLKALQLFARNQQVMKERLEFFQTLLNGRPVLNDPRYEAFGLQIQKQTFVISIKITKYSDRAAQQVIQFLVQYFEKQPFVFIHQNRIIWVLQGNEEFRERIKKQLIVMLENWAHFNSQQMVIGVGTLQENLLEVKVTAEESEQTIQHATPEQIIAVMYYEDLGINRLFVKQTKEEIQFFVDQVLAPLIYKKDDTLWQTLAMYIQQNRSIQQTAQRLHIHQNTLYHRLNKIEELLGKRLSDAQQLLEITLAMHLYETN